jgi:hypothetical protein
MMAILRAINAILGCGDSSPPSVCGIASLASSTKVALRRTEAAMNRRTPSNRHGFSLAEVVVGAGVLAMFMVGLPLAVRMARNAVPDGSNTPSAAMNASRVLELMASDIAFATSVNSSAQYDPNHLTITVADRNGDGVQETIAYACAPPPPGSLPAPPPGTQLLTRTYNGTALALLSNVQEFGFTYDTSSVAGQSASGTPALLLTINSGSGLTTDGVSATNWVGEYFQPVLPAGAVSWNLTSVQLQVEKGIVKDVANVKILNAVGDLPGTTVLDTSATNASNLSAGYTWQIFPFTNVNNVSPSAGLFVVVTSADSSSSANVQHCSNSSARGGYVSSTNGGATWTPNPSNDLMLEVYGTVNTPNTGPSGSTYYLKDVRVKLRTNQNNQSRVLTTIRTYNQPQVPHP